MLECMAALSWNLGMVYQRQCCIHSPGLLSLVYKLPPFPQTYRSQSTVTIMAASSGGSPTAIKTMTSVKSPAWGTPAAPMLAAVAVMLRGGRTSNRVHDMVGKKWGCLVN